MSTPEEDPRYLERLMRALRTTAREVTPWFVEQMPESYFRDTDEATVVAHLAAVVAARISGASPRILLRDEERETWTFIQERSYRGLLSGVLKQLPSGRPLASAKVHTAADDSLILDVFRFGRAPRFDSMEPAMAKKQEEALAYARGLGDPFAPSDLPRYLARSSADFVRAASPLRLHETWILVKAVEGTDRVASSVSLQGESGLTRISVAAGNADTQKLFERIVNHLGRRKLDITRAFLDVFEGETGWVSSLGFVVHDPEGRLLDGSAWPALERELARLPWLDDQVLARIDRHPDEPWEVAEVLVALSHLAHAHLTRVDPFAHARDRLLGHLDQHVELARAIAKLFLERFDPVEPLSDERVKTREEEIGADIARALEAEPGRQFFDLLLRAVTSVTRTNVYVGERGALAIRVDPALFDVQDETDRERPYSVVFVQGQGLDGYHVRFTDIARGGIRVVRPPSDEQHILEAERLYEETLGLARAQQLKNKDIPEGGAKAVVLLTPGASLERSVRAFVDALLDLSVEVGGQVLDRGSGPDAPLHLGPGENVSPDLIHWVVSRAEARGHPLPGAFMSSKPDVGIDHKDYGVTSEGVNVFLVEALRAVGIDPREQSFTVKMTGGPDGDVAGNQLRILHREFGDRARVVGLADGTGSAWDPEGLDHAELLRLVDLGQGIADFDPGRLGPSGGVLGLDAPEGLARRNGLFFELEADAFIPAGGRPATIHAGNWRRFLDPEGRPSSRVIVEGANLFLTPEARLGLSEAGVLIVKDSSANKCGVISSSLEVAASMLLTVDELRAHKDRFVAEVLERLRQLAREEARRLFTDYARDPSVPLPDRSERLSRAILATTDAVEAVLDELDPSTLDELDEVIRSFLPPVIVEVAAARLHERLPARYRARVVATRLAARFVYREGVEVLAGFPTPQALGRAALAYHRHESEVRRLADGVRRSGLPDGERVAELLEAGGPRAALFEDL